MAAGYTPPLETQPRPTASFQAVTAGEQAALFPATGVTRTGSRRCSRISKDCLLDQPGAAEPLVLRSNAFVWDVLPGLLAQPNQHRDRRLDIAAWIVAYQYIGPGGQDEPILLMLGYGL